MASKQNKFEHARSKLALSSVPQHLPCRAEQIARIYTSLQNAISLEKGLTMYIAGETGTGKTAVVCEVLRQLQEQLGEATPFKPLFINAMKLKTPADAYKKLYTLMTASGEASPSGKKTRKTKKKRGAPVTRKNIATFLANTFAKSTKHRPYMVIVIDELDFLVTKGQQEVYEFFNWPQYPSSKLCVIGIANTVNLPERLIPKIASRLEMTERISFPAYKHEEISEILLDRVNKLNVFEPKAVDFCAKKVASSSGDIRRAFDICRRAVEMVEEHLITNAADKSAFEARKVTVHDIHNAYKDLFSVVDSYPIANLPYFHKLFLVCALMEQKSAKVHDLSLEHVSRLTREILNNIMLTLFIFRNTDYI